MHQGKLQHFVVQQDTHLLVATGRRRTGAREPSFPYNETSIAKGVRREAARRRSELASAGTRTHLGGPGGCTQLQAFQHFTSQYLKIKDDFERIADCYTIPCRTRSLNKAGTEYQIFERTKKSIGWSVPLKLYWMVASTPSGALLFIFKNSANIFIA